MRAVGMLTELLEGVFDGPQLKEFQMAVFEYSFQTRGMTNYVGGDTGPAAKAKARARALALAAKIAKTGKREKALKRLNSTADRNDEEWQQFIAEMRTALGA